MAGSELIGDIELKYVNELFSKGPPVNLYRYHPAAYMAKAFEARVAERLNVKHAHLCSSGTAAIEIALFSAGIGPGDEVITTAFTFVAPVEAIVRLGAVPVCVDINETFNIDVARIERAITEKTKAICSVPMWGACDMAELVALCEKHDLILIEDAAQALSATYQGKPLGTFGKIGAFSLDAGKTLSAGEGGFIVTNDTDTYEVAASYSDHGHLHQTDRPRGQDGVKRPGFNYRASELTAAVAMGQLDRLDDILERQRTRNANLATAIEGFDGVSVRRSSDPDGELGDTLIMTFKDEATATDLAQRYAEVGVNSKILPEAFNWHFAGSWNHIWDLVPDARSYIEQANGWGFTRNLLARSIALPVSVHDNPEWDDKVLKVLSERMA